MSGTRRIVSDAGPLISLEKISGGFEFIRLLYDVVMVPTAVIEEVTQGHQNRAQAYLQHYGIDDLIEVHTVLSAAPLPEAERLHDGEAQAIRLALASGLPLLIEERTGRRVAAALGLSVSGIAGQIVRAHRHEVLSAEDARGKLHELLAAGRISKDLFEGLAAVLEKRE